MIKKVPSTIETEELLKTAEEDSNEKVFSYKNDVLTFISDFSIEPGKEPIRQTTLFSIYKVWSKSPVLKADFLKELNMFFKRSNNCYLLNNNAIKLTHEIYSQFKKEHPERTKTAQLRIVKDFLDYHGLKEGDYSIHEQKLYAFYLEYANKKDFHFTFKFQTIEVFNKQMDKLLKSKITAKGKYYNISKNIINFIKEDNVKEADKTQQTKAPESRS